MCTVGLLQSRRLPIDARTGSDQFDHGVADADMDRVPGVAIAGQGATTRMHKESHQILDLVR
jgi:hypothetical protein